MKINYLILFIAIPVFAQYLPQNRPYEVIDYKLNFEINPIENPDTLMIETEINGKALAPLYKIELDKENLKTIDAKSWNKKNTLPFDDSNPKILIISLEKPYKKNSVFKIHIKSEAKIQNSHEGFFKVVDPDAPERGNLYFTMFEPEMARSVFPCNDEPYDKATTQVTAKLPREFQFVSNGMKTKDIPYKKNGLDWHEVQWKMPKPHSTYLISLAIGKFEKISELYKGKEISIYTSKNTVDKARFALNSTLHSISFFEKYLGVSYPWPKYAVIGIPTYLWGGMENTSSTHMNQERTLLNDLLSSFEKKKITSLSAHELAHQWFGDLVTMKWWDDIWMNEAFASYMDTLGQKESFKTDEAEIEFMTDLWDSYFREEDGPRSHPLVNPNLTSSADGFDSTNYTKGQALLRMLEFYLGKENFKRGLKNYLSDYSFNNANHEDFFASIEKTTKIDLKKFRSWLHLRGYPQLLLQESWQGGVYTLKIQQRPNHEFDSHLFHFKLPIVIHRNSTPSYHKDATLMINDSETIYSLPLPAEPEWVNPNEKGIALALIRPQILDEKKIALQLFQDPDPFSRVWAAYQLLNPLLKGEALSGLAESIILKSLMEEPSPYVRNAILEGLQRSQKKLPDILSHGIIELSKLTMENNFEVSPLFKKDPHGEREWRSLLIGTLGKTSQDEAIQLLTQTLDKENISIDDLEMATQSMAKIGTPEALARLSKAMQTHGKKTYRNQFHISMALGAFENILVIPEIEKLAKTAAPDLMGRLGWIIVDNSTLKNSKEWAVFVEKFTLDNNRFSDEVKARLLQTIENIKSEAVDQCFQHIHEKTLSPRLKDLTKPRA